MEPFQEIPSRVRVVLEGAAWREFVRTAIAPGASATCGPGSRLRPKPRREQGLGRAGDEPSREIE